MSQGHCFFLLPSWLPPSFCFSLFLTSNWAGVRPSPSPPPFSRPLVSPSSQLINEFRWAWSFIWVITAQASGATPRLQGQGEINILSGSSLSPRAPSIKSNPSQARGRGAAGSLGRSCCRARAAGRGPGRLRVQRCFGGTRTWFATGGRAREPEERGGKIRERGWGGGEEKDAFGG